MMKSNLELAALVGSRICHDLISPIGAVNNGLELLNMSGFATDGPEIALIADSVINASARVRFFRIAYGAASDQPVARSEVVSILNDMTKGNRLEINWAPQEGQSRSMTRLAFLAIQCLETAMPYGGQIEITRDDSGWIVRGESKKMLEINALWDELEAVTPKDDLKSAHVHFALLPIAAAECGHKIQASHSATHAEIAF